MIDKRSAFVPEEAACYGKAPGGPGQGASGMWIRFWGARGSVPVSGREYLRYGGDTTCIELRSAGGELIILDAGTGMRGLGNRLVANGPVEVNLLFTHAHWDHLLGLPFFKPLYDAACRLRVFGCPCSQESIQELISGAMEPPNFPVRLSDAKAEVSFHDHCGGSFLLGGVLVTPILLSHTNPGLGYRFEEAGRCLVVLTDNELRYQHPEGKTFAEYVEFCRGADLLIHDAQYTPGEYERKRRWGHSTYRDAVDLALEANVKALGLCHHDQDRTDADIDEIVETCRELLARERAGLECFAVRQGMEREI